MGANNMPKIPLSQDEWLICLEFYLRRRQQIKGGARADVRELSGLLRAIGQVVHGRTDISYRPPDGVSRRVSEFTFLDPASPSFGKREPAAQAREVWQAWGDKPYPMVKQLVRAICAWLPEDEYEYGGVQEPVAPYGDQTELNDTLLDAQVQEIPSAYGGKIAVEGRILTRVHRVRERNQKLVTTKKEKFQDENRGRLYCEACRFDFADSYPKHGEGFIECHHLRPLSQLQPDTITTLDDLALLCANCHRMVHYRSPWLTMDGLRELVLVGRARH